MSLDPEMMQDLLEKVQRIVEDEGTDKLLRVCRLLKDEVKHYDWVGFYLVDRERERDLVLGPYAGEPTEHIHISFGKGICGQAADTGRLFLIQDVSKESNYLSCSSEVRSEIVLPIFIKGRLAAELDIDSHILHPFTDADTMLLEGVCRKVSPLL